MDFLKSFRNYGRAWAMISALRLWRVAFIPGFISLILGGGIFWLGWEWKDLFATWLGSFYPENWYGKAFIGTILKSLGILLTFFGGFFTYKNLIIPISSPFLSIISARVEAKLTEKPVEEPPFLEALTRGLSLTFRNLFKELFFTISLLLLGFVPFLTIFIAPLIFLVQSNYAGFGNMDFALERFFNRQQSVSFVRAHRLMAVGNGAAFLALLFLPVLGLLIAPALSVAAATIGVVEKIKK
ncbi:MAG: hypothetical protein RL757_3362 [Bacteroidota bacterium]|jgi:CysZ protein